jgi:hypothetical protein
MFIGLYKETKKNKMATEEALNLVLKLIKNICDNFNDDKYKTIKKVYITNFDFIFSIKT